MTSFKTVLMSATALGLMAGVAMAQSNESFTKQDGDNNDLLVEQDVDNNAGNQNRVGTATQRVLQNGNGNTLSIDQVADATTNARVNSIGTQGGPAEETFDYAPIGGFAGGFEQRGNGNQATLTQGASGAPVYDGDNRIDNILQFTDSAFTPGGTAPNTLTINQQGRHGVVENVAQSQYNNGDTSDTNNIDIQQTGLPSVQAGMGSRVFDVEQVAYRGANALDISQDSNGSGTSGNNAIGAITQVANGEGNNMANLSQTGGSNYIQSGRQVNSGGGTNAVAMSFDGEENGRSGFTGGTSGAGSIALTSANVGLESGVNGYYQEGTDNTINYDVAGNNNSFAFQQFGGQNLIDGRVGSENLSEDNEVAVVMRGYGNTVYFDQNDYSNDIGLNILGDDNHLDVQQRGSFTTGNTVTVDIDGNRNNQDIGSAATGAALTAAVAGQAADDAFTRGGLRWGSLLQDGTDNSIALSVNSSDNRFAMLQDGDDNSIVGEIVGAGDNQAVVVQFSDGNVANFVQDGSNNSLGIIQNGS